jgi:hypothetical protein
MIWDLIFLTPARNTETALLLLLECPLPIMGFIWNGEARHRTPLLKGTKIPGFPTKKKDG